MKDQLSDTAHEVQFAQHKRQVLDIFNHFDIAHIAIAGEVAKYMVANNISEISPDIVDYVEELQQKRHVIYDAETPKNKSRSSSKDSFFSCCSAQDSIPDL